METEKPIRINKEDIGKLNAFFSGKITELNEKRIVLQRTQTKFSKIFAYVFGTVIMVCTIGMIAVSAYFTIDGEIDLWLFIFLSVCMALLGIIGLILILQAYVSEKQFVIFDRENQTITQPKNAFSTEPLTYLVNQIDIFVTGGGRGTPHSTGLKKYTGKFMGIVIYQTDSYYEDAAKRLENFWNYILAYMTNNTLPEGSAFDNYR